jgi:hypothetical protein
MDQESTYLGLLTAVTGAQMQGNALILTSPSGSLNYYQALTVTPY